MRQRPEAYLRKEVRKFIEYIEGPERELSENTVRAYEGALYRMEFYLKTVNKQRKPLRDIKLRHLRKFLEWRKEILSSPSLKTGAQTIRGTIAALKSFFRWAANEGYIEADPASALMSPKLPKVTPKTVSEKEYKLVILACKGRLDDIELLEFMAGTGVRRDEIRGITVADVMEVGEVIRITGKGNKTRLNPLVSKATFKMIRKRIERYNLGVNDPVFDLKAQAVAYIIRQILALPQLKSKGVTITPHSLRRFYADRLLDKDVRLDVIQEVMGHESIETTRIYAKTSMRRIMAERSKIESECGVT